MHPDDRADTLAWLIDQVKRYSPEFGRDQLNRNRMHAAEQLRDEAQKEART